MHQKITRIRKVIAIMPIIGSILASTLLGTLAVVTPTADAATTCQNLAITGVSASTYESVNPPSNAIDNALSTRWSGEGMGAWIRADLGQQQTICSVDIAWYKGNSRINTFVIAVSKDSTTYTNIYSGKNSGSTTSPERYSFGEVSARYVRITVTANSDNNNWASITEIDVRGYDPNPDTTAPSIAISSPLAYASVPAGNIEVTGTASDNNAIKSVEVKVGGGAYIKATPVPAGDWSSGGNWAATVNIANPGGYSITTRATDMAGNMRWQNLYLKVVAPDSGSLDNFGIKKIYPTKSGGNEWYVNMADPASDPMFRNLETMTKQSDGSWQVDGGSNGQVRLEAWSPSNEKWLNVEITMYAKMVSGSNELLQLYSRGGHHTSSNECLGSAVKARLYGDGEARWVKEINHPAYTSNRGSVQATNEPLADRWVGFKAVIYNFVENGKTYVRMESYIDDDVTDSRGNLVIANNWKLASVVEDRGGWGTNDSDFNSSCAPLNKDSTYQYRQRDEILNMPGGTSTQNIAAFRSDDLTWNWKYLTVREIVVPPS